MVAKVKNRRLSVNHQPIISISSVRFNELTAPLSLTILWAKTQMQNLDKGEQHANITIDNTIESADNCICKTTFVNADLTNVSLGLIMLPYRHCQRFRRISIFS